MIPQILRDPVIQIVTMTNLKPRVLLAHVLERVLEPLRVQNLIIFDQYTLLLLGLPLRVIHQRLC